MAEAQVADLETPRGVGSLAHQGQNEQRENPGAGQVGEVLISHLCTSSWAHTDIPGVSPQLAGLAGAHPAYRMGAHSPEDKVTAMRNGAEGESIHGTHIPATPTHSLPRETHPLLSVPTTVPPTTL